METFLRPLRAPATWLAVLCAGMSLAFGHACAARAKVAARLAGIEADYRTLQRGYAELARRTGPAVPPPTAAALPPLALPPPGALTAGR